MENDEAKWLGESQTLSARAFGKTLVLELREKRRSKPTARALLEINSLLLSTDPNTQAEQLARTIEALQRRLPMKEE